MFKENDPIVDSVRLVMEQNALRRQVEELVNEEFGVTSRKGLPHELYAEYDAVLAEAIEYALEESGGREYAIRKAVEKENDEDWEKIKHHYPKVERPDYRKPPKKKNVKEDALEEMSPDALAAYQQKLHKKSWFGLGKSPMENARENRDKGYARDYVKRNKGNELAAKKMNPLSTGVKVRARPALEEDALDEVSIKRAIKAADERQDRIGKGILRKGENPQEDGRRRDLSKRKALESPKAKGDHGERFERARSQHVRDKFEAGDESRVRVPANEETLEEAHSRKQLRQAISHHQGQEDNIESLLANKTPKERKEFLALLTKKHRHGQARNTAYNLLTKNRKKWTNSADTSLEEDSHEESKGRKKAEELLGITRSGEETKNSPKGGITRTWKGTHKKEEPKKKKPFDPHKPPIHYWEESGQIKESFEKFLRNRFLKD